MSTEMQVENEACPSKKRNAKFGNSYIGNTALMTFEVEKRHEKRQNHAASCKNLSDLRQQAGH